MVFLLIALKSVVSVTLTVCLLRNLLVLLTVELIDMLEKDSVLTASSLSSRQLQRGVLELDKSGVGRKY